ncbi:MAG: hypothetical protein Fur0039_05640 [Rhodocyclaceae bacterium]
MRPGLRALGAAACLLLAAAAAAFDRPAHDFPATGTVEVAFAPWDDPEAVLLGALARAKQAIYVQAYLLTSRGIAAALIAARLRGVEVQVLADREMTLRGDNSQLPLIAAAGIPVALETRYQAAHNKVVLVDPEGRAPAVLTGSYNFTWSARTKNAENLIVLRGNPALARAYLDNWLRHRAEAVPWDGLPGE